MAGKLRSTPNSLDKGSQIADKFNRYPHDWGFMLFVIKVLTGEWILPTLRGHSRSSSAQMVASLAKHDPEAPLLSFQEAGPGKLKCILDIRRLFPDPGEAGRFRTRLRHFLDSLGRDADLFNVGLDRVEYDSEQIVPAHHDDRPFLLLVFGNPATHSVRSGMFFASEGNGREHRFWGVMDRAGYFRLPRSAPPMDRPAIMDDRNRLRREAMLDLSYVSPFRIGMTVFYTMPSPASIRPWAGCAGLVALFGIRAIRQIAAHEQARVEGLIRDFVQPGGAVMAFQKDAYEALRSITSPEYRLADARKGKLVGTLGFDEGTRLFCCPPTRLMHGSKCLQALELFRRLMAVEA